MIVDKHELEHRTQGFALRIIRFVADVAKSNNLPLTIADSKSEIGNPNSDGDCGSKRGTLQSRISLQFGLRYL